jgi:hypothetical protein
LRVEDFNAIKNQERGLPVGGKSSNKQRASKGKASQGGAGTPVATTPVAADTGAGFRIPDAVPEAI